jgi:hypothetical protein
VKSSLSDFIVKTPFSDFIVKTPFSDFIVKTPFAAAAFLALTIGRLCDTMVR